MNLEETLRQLLADYGKLSTPVDQLTDTSDLYRAGLTSHATITLMLAIEDTFEVEFPQEVLRKSTFESIKAIAHELTALGVDADGPS